MTFKELCTARFSARSYTQEKVSDDDLRYILECTRLAPSAVNRQPWKFVVVRSDEAREKLQECYNRDWFKSAPLYILCLKKEKEGWIRKADNKQHADIDMAIAIEHLCMAATERGLGTCWVCNYDPTKLSGYFAFPDYEAVAIIPLGHIAEDCPRPEKQRKNIEEIIEEV